MKKNHDFGHYTSNVWSKTLKVMKLTILLVLLGIFSVSAEGYGQGGNISLKMEHVSLEDILQELKAHSDYTFVYSDQQVGNVEVDLFEVKDANLEVVMNECLQDTDLEFYVENNVVVIRKKAPVVKESNQQEKKEIKGTVTDADGGTLPGVSVVVKGTSIGTATDINGNYSLEIPMNAEALVFSFIGMKASEIAYAGQLSINVVLTADSEQMAEVVVTGYGSRSKESYTGAAVTIEGDELVQTNSSNLLLSLQAIEPSFVMIENLDAGSNPNALPDFQIRGSASVPGLQSEFKGNPNMPLFMLDGFEADATIIFDMDPNRVKSFTILKDASATAIYGSRGANGVVVVETHAPKKGKMRVSYNVDLSVTAADLSDYDLLNAEEKLQLEVDAGHYSVDGSGLVSIIDDRKEIYNSKLQDIREGVDTYWIEKPVEDQINHKHTLGLQGGNDTFRYGMDLSYQNNDGVMKGSGRDRYGIGLTLQYRVEKFTFKNNLTYYNVNSTNSPYGSFREYTRMNPYLRYEDDNGQMMYEIDQDEYGRAVYNPLFNSTLNTTNKNGSNNFRNNFGVDWNINTSSSLRGSISLSQKTSSSDIFRPAKHTDFANFSGDDLERKGRYDVSNGKESNIEASLTYTYMLKKGYSMLFFSTTGNVLEQKSESYSAAAEGFPSEDMDNISFAKQYVENGRPSGSEYVSRSLGWLGTINYSYDNRYFGDISYRFDASSRFGADKRWAPFGSVGAGWNVHNEKFLKGSELVNKLKFRVSYGLTGSQNFDPYQAMSTYQLYNDTRYHYGYGFVMKALGNDKLQWQKTLKTNFGVDAELFNNRLTLSANYYNDLSKDVLVPVSLPTSLGFNTYMENLGEIENKGYELKARVFILKKSDLTLSVFGSAMHNKNQLKKLSNSLSAINDAQDESFENERDEDSNKLVVNRPKVRYIEGESANTIWAVRSLGIDPSTGSEVFLNKDGQKTNIWNAKDQVAAGTTDADIIGNFGTNFSYKGFQLNMIFNYRLGGEMYNQTLVDRVENADLRFNVDRRVYDGRWRQPGDKALFKNVADNTQTKPTSRFVEEYNYLKLSSLNVAYNFEVEKYGFERLKLMFTMNDVFRSSSVQVERGLSYPFARTFTFSLQTTF